MNFTEGAFWVDLFKGNIESISEDIMLFDSKIIKTIATSLNMKTVSDLCKDVDEFETVEKDGLVKFLCEFGNKEIISALIKSEIFNIDMELAKAVIHDDALTIMSIVSNENFDIEMIDKDSLKRLIHEKYLESESVGMSEYISSFNDEEFCIDLSNILQEDLENLVQETLEASGCYREFIDRIDGLYDMKYKDGKWSVKTYTTTNEMDDKLREMNLNDECIYHDSDEEIDEMHSNEDDEDEEDEEEEEACVED